MSPNLKTALSLTSALMLIGCNAGDTSLMPAIKKKDGAKLTLQTN